MCEEVVAVFKRVLCPEPVESFQRGAVDFFAVRIGIKVFFGLYCFGFEEHSVGAQDNVSHVCRIAVGR